MKIEQEYSVFVHRVTLYFGKYRGAIITYRDSSRCTTQVSCQVTDRHSHVLLHLGIRSISDMEMQIYKGNNLLLKAQHQALDNAILAAFLLNAEVILETYNCG